MGDPLGLPPGWTRRPLPDEEPEVPTQGDRQSAEKMERIKPKEVGEYYFPSLKGKAVKVISDISGACVSIKRAFQALVTYMSYDNFPVFSKSTTKTFEEALNKEKVRDPREPEDTLKEVLGVEGWILSLNKLEEPLEGAHPKQFLFDIGRAVMEIEGTRKIEMPKEEELGNELRNRTANAIGNAITSLLNKRFEERKDITPKEVQLLRYQIEDLMSQKLNTLNSSVLKGRMADYSSGGNIVAFEKGNKTYKLSERNGCLVISTAVFMSIYEEGKDKTAGDLRGYDAIRYEVIIDMSKISAKDLLFTEGCAAVRTETYGFRPKKEEISF